ncbi:AlpA family phage regulatory protein [Agrobacterium rhizogenes]|uniref:helix-turn-helix transcriptional regulator n=1 Tax=Rhizobium rhizogenes TaxID=359 RepID=UPI001572B02D|nr:AlpA family phage regulatory protein [Rhizobium rhizogenes]NTI62120.1 AlpA family phage regulatory protein [Rhizobium rhizogenes]
MTLIGYKELQDRGIPYSETHLYRLMKAGQFPQAVKLGEQPNSRRSWIASEIDQWLEARIARRDGARQ